MQGIETHETPPTTIIGLSENTYKTLHELNLLRPSSDSGVLGVRKTTYCENTYFVRHPRRGYLGTFVTKETAAEAVIAATRDAEPDELFARPFAWEQRLRACALNMELQQYLLRNTAKRERLTVMVRRYFIEYEPDTLNLLFGSHAWQVDHIVPQHVSGPASNIVENLFLMEETANKHFGAHEIKMDEKRSFVGEQIFTFAQQSVLHEQKRPRLHK